jgi:AcrR family transcriptional regulator
MDMTTRGGDERPAGEPQSAGHRSGRTGRRAGPTETRGDIIRAARKLFAERGYNGTTMRTIAVEARVDAALIHHFFTSKEKVFVATVQDVLQESDATEGPPDGEALVREFLLLWEGGPEVAQSMRALFGSALSHDQAAGLLPRLVSERLVDPLVGESAAADGPLCTTVLTSQLIGVALMRYVLGAEPLASVDLEVLTKTLGQYFQNLLDGGPRVQQEFTTPGLPPLV